MRAAIAMVGRRYGSLVVLEFAGWSLHPCGQTHRLWLCRCDCGRLSEAQGYSLRSGDTQHCWRCGHISAGEKTSTLLSTGETISSLARRTGVKLNTILIRMRRGWPHERLGEPARGYRVSP